MDEEQLDQIAELLLEKLNSDKQFYDYYILICNRLEIEPNLETAAIFKSGFFAGYIEASKQKNYLLFDIALSN